MLDAGGGGEGDGEDLLVFFGLEGAGGVEEVASGGEAGQGGGEDFALAGGLAGEVGGLEAVADFRVAAEGAGAAAGDVAEDEVEEAEVFGEGGGVGLDGLRVWGAMRFEAGGEGLEAAGAGVGGEEGRGWDGGRRG